MSSRYFTGEPCIHGHLAERYVSTKGCVECTVENSRNRKGMPPTPTRMAWLAANREHLREYHREWRMRNRDKVLSYSRKRRQD